MRRLTITAAATAAALAAGSAAYAFTPAPRPATPGDLTEVSGGCGLGWHLSADGLCRRDAVPPVYRPYAYATPPYAGTCWLTATAFGPRRVCAW